MNAAVLYLTIVSKRMLTLHEAAQQCGRSSNALKLYASSQGRLFPTATGRLMSAIWTNLDPFKRDDDDTDAIVDEVSATGRALSPTPAWRRSPSGRVPGGAPLR